MCMICIEDLPPQFDALLARLHPQLMLIFATIVLDLPKSALGSFRPLQESSPCVLSSDSFSLAYWNFRLIVLKHIFILFCHNIINGWSRISKKSNYFHWRSSSAKAFDNCDSSIIFSAWCRCRLILSLWLFTRSIRLTQSPTVTFGGGTIWREIEICPDCDDAPLIEICPDCDDAPCIYIYIYTQFFPFYPLGLPAKTFVFIALTPITADRYVVTNGHYSRGKTRPVSHTAINGWIRLCSHCCRRCHFIFVCVQWTMKIKWYSLQQWLHKRIHPTIVQREEVRKKIVRLYSSTVHTKLIETQCAHICGSHRHMALADRTRQRGNVVANHRLVF